MKKAIALGIVFLLVMVSFTSISGIQINENIVIPSYMGNILYVGGNGTGNYSSIQDAVDDASDGDTVFVFDDSSPYCENIFINQSIDLIGEDRNNTIINGNNNDNVIQINANYVIISSFTLQNSGDYFLDTGITVGSYYNPCNYATIINNNIFNNSLGINLDVDSSYNNISGNDISYNQENGIWIDDGLENVIQGNIISNNGERGIISTSFFSRSKIINNRIFNNDWGGIRIDGSYAEICFNEIYSNRVNGIWMGGGFPIKNVIISNNKIYSNLGHGIHFWGFISGTLVNCEISNNHIESNLLCGIKLRWAELNKIINNNIYNNVVNVRFCNSFGNKWDGNYWGTSKKIKVITGSIRPFDWIPLPTPLLLITIPMFNFDFHPAKEPYNYTTTQEYDLV